MYTRAAAGDARSLAQSCCVNAPGTKPGNQAFVSGITQNSD
jgi:hypothetical protein